MVARLIDGVCHERHSLVGMLRGTRRDGEDDGRDEEILHEKLGRLGDDEVRGDGRGDGGVGVGGDEAEEVGGIRGDVREGWRSGEVEGDLARNAGSGCATARQKSAADPNATLPRSRVGSEGGWCWAASRRTPELCSGAPSWGD